MKLIKYTQEDLKNAVKTSVSIRQALLKLNIEAKGGNYRIFHKAVKYFNIDISHFTGQNLSGRTLPQRRKTLEEYLTKNSGIQSNKLRKYLLDAGIFQPICSSCSLITWLEKPIPLELEHKDGDHTNNELYNLCLLCPNCHAQTETYRGKNKKTK